MEVIRENIMSPASTKSSRQLSVEITNREKEVLQLICEQCTAQEIADRLYISVRTVDGHRNNLLSKLNCRNTAGLVVYALQHGLVKVE
jgi:DNA-binding CsgD family transcriptional regulator